MADSEVPAITLPLTPYDMMGYLAPGGTVLLSILAFEFFVKTLVAPQVKDAGAWHTPLLSAFSSLYASVVQHDNSVSLVVFAVGFAAVAYIAGHVIGSASSLLLDRTFIFKGYGYPYSDLLRLKREQTVTRAFSRDYYRGLFFWVNAYFIVRYTSLFVAVPLKLRIDPETLGRTANGIAWFVVACFIFKVVVRSRLAGRRTWKHPARQWSMRIVGFLMAAPYELFARPMGKIMNTRNAFDEQFLSRYHETFRSVFGFNSRTAGTNNYWMCYCYVLERCAELRNLVTHWLRMYIFARNLATGLYVAFLYCFSWLVIEAPRAGFVARGPGIPILLMPLLLLASSFLLLIRYYYLFVSYFTKFIFRAFVFAESRATPPDLIIRSA